MLTTEMSKPRIADLEGFVSYVEDRPKRLGCWRDGIDGICPTLAWINTQPVVEQRELAKQVGPHAAVAMTTSAHHNQVGIAARWVLCHMTGPRRGTPTSNQDRVALLETAGRYWGVRNLIYEVYAAVRGFEVEGTKVRLPYNGNHEIDGLDRLLDLIEQLDGFEPSDALPNHKVRAWLAGVGLTTPWGQAPEWAKDGLRSLAAAVLSKYPTYLPALTEVAGFTIADLDAYWRELMARGMHMNAATMQGSDHAPTIVPLIERVEFVASMARSAGLADNAADRITTHLTMAPDGPDPALTPLVPVGSGIIPMSSLIMPGSPQRNTLSIIQANPATFGEAGRLLGEIGERAVLETLSRMSEKTLVGKRIRAVRTNGQPAGDLDVVALDPRTGAAAIFEIKWHIAADGNEEVYRLERAAIEKRKQVARLRGEIEAGTASVLWPSDWPNVDMANARWFILTRDVLAMRSVSDDDVTLRSNQLLSRTLRKDATVGELIDALDNPPIPPPELLGTQWERMRYGDLRIDVEQILA